MKMLSENDFLILSRDQQENYLRLLESEYIRLKSRRLMDYQPHPKQREFHESPASCRAAFGGNRSGKTTMGVVEFLFHVTGQYPDWFPKENRFDKSIIGRIICTDFGKGAGEVIIPAIDEWLHDSIIAKKVRNHIGTPIKWILKNGSQFDILTHEQDTNLFEGWKGHLAWFDEPPPRDRYIATLRGLVDFKGRHMLTLTPLSQPWIYDDIYTKADGKNIFVVTVDMSDNPHLSKEARDEFSSRLTEDEKEARLHGKFMHLSGLVYKEFSPGYSLYTHRIDLENCTRYFAIDPHTRTNIACNWLAVDPKGFQWIYDELWVGGLSISQLAEAILSQEGDYRPHIRLIDPHADKDEMYGGGGNIRRELMKYGVVCQRANSDPNLGKSLIRSALMPQYSKLIGRSIPNLRVHTRCTQTIYEFQHYMWDEFRRNPEEHGVKEQVKKKDDHHMDCLRYIFNFGAHYVDQNASQYKEVQYAGQFERYPLKHAEDESKYYTHVERVR